MADGYPPYQFLDGNGNPVGMDIDVIRLVFKKIGRKLVLVSGHWDDVVTNLRLGNLDCVAGMEISKRRRKFFEFTSPYHRRKGGIFVREDSKIRSVFDLQWQVVAGDRDSYVEGYLGEIGLYRHIRLYQTRSKAQSIDLLKRREVVAAIAPVAVGEYLARKYGVAVRWIDVGDPGSPVGIAVARKNHALWRQVETALCELAGQGAFDDIIARWLH